jgi:Coenzyme PQQ synthesis protein D (PqqD)
MHVTPGHIRLRTTALHWRELDGDVIALDGKRSNYLAANSSGALLWRALSEGATRDGLADALVAAYGIKSDRALADVDAYLAELDAQGLLEK